MNFIAYLIFVIGMLILYALPANRYDWITEFDPSISAGAFEDTSGNAVIFATLVALCVVASQVFLLSKTKLKSQRIISVLMLVIVVFTWVFKFLH